MRRGGASAAGFFIASLPVAEFHLQTAFVVVGEVAALMVVLVVVMCTVYSNWFSEFNGVIAVTHQAVTASNNSHAAFFVSDPTELRRICKQQLSHLSYLRINKFG